MLSIPTDLQKPCSENGMFIQQQATRNLRSPSYSLLPAQSAVKQHMIRLILPFAENSWHFTSKIVVEESIKHWKNKTNNLSTNTPQAQPISTSLLFLLRWSKPGSDHKALLWFARGDKDWATGFTPGPVPQLQTPAPRVWRRFFSLLNPTMLVSATVITLFSYLLAITSFFSYKALSSHVLVLRM